jgi:hypothetical protein
MITKSLRNILRSYLWNIIYYESSTKRIAWKDESGKIVKIDGKAYVTLMEESGTSKSNYYGYKNCTRKATIIQNGVSYVISKASE